MAAQTLGGWRVETHTNTDQTSIQTCAGTQEGTCTSFAACAHEYTLRGWAGTAACIQ